MDKDLRRAANSPGRFLVVASKTDESQIIILRSIGGEPPDVREERHPQRFRPFGCASDDFPKPVRAIQFTLRIACLGYPIGVEDKCIAGLHRNDRLLIRPIEY